MSETTELPKIDERRLLVYADPFGDGATFTRYDDEAYSAAYLKLGGSADFHAIAAAMSSAIEPDMSAEENRWNVVNALEALRDDIEKVVRSVKDQPLAAIMVAPKEAPEDAEVEYCGQCGAMTWHCEHGHCSDCTSSHKASECPGCLPLKAWLLAEDEA
jgi:hypothetical protein